MSFQVVVEDVKLSGCTSGKSSEKCRLRCGFGTTLGSGLEHGLDGNWKGESKEWRNELERSGEMYASKRYWFKGNAVLSQLSEDAVSKVASCQGLCLQALKIKEGEERSIGSYILPLTRLLRGSRIRETCIFTPAEGAESESLQVTITVNPDKALVDFLLGGHILTLQGLKIVDAPKKLYAHLLGSPEGGESTDPVSAEVIAERLDSSPIRIQAACFADVASKQLHDYKPEQAEEKEDEATERLEGGEEGDAPDRSKVKIFSVENLRLVFESAARSFSIEADKEPGPAPVRFISRKTAHSLRKRSSWTELDIEWSVKNAGENLAPVADASLQQEENDTRKPVRVTIKVGELGSAGVSCCEGVSSCGAIRVSVGCEPSLHQMEPVPALQTNRVALGSFAKHARLSVKSGTDEEEDVDDEEQPRVLLRSNARAELAALLSMGPSTNFVQAAGRRERARRFLLKSMEEDKVLQLDLTRKGHTTCAAELLAAFLPSTEECVLASGKDSIVEDLQRLAEEAEFTGNLDRCDEIWRSGVCLNPSASTLGYAKFALRSGKLLRAMELLNRWKKLNNSTEQGFPKQLDVPSYVARFKRTAMESDGALLALLCAYEQGDKEALLFASKTDGEEDSESDKDVVQREKIAAGMRSLAAVALAFQLPIAGRAALVHANMRDPAPLCDAPLLQNEQLRARYKLLTGMPEAAQEILSAATEDSESLSLKNCPESARATTFLLLGRVFLARRKRLQESSAQESSPLSQKARAAFASCLSILHEAEESKDPEEVSQRERLLLQVTREMGLLALENRDWRKARVIFKQPLSRQAELEEGTARPIIGTLAWAWRGLGEACANLNQLDKADESFKRAVILDQGDAAAWGHMAIVQLTRGNVNEAIHAVELSLDCGLDDARLLERIEQQLLQADHAARPLLASFSDRVNKRIASIATRAASV